LNESTLSTESPIGVLETLLPPQTYFSIGEVSRLTQVKPYVIRYWESQFGSLRPPRRDSGQRKFTQKEVDTILSIKELLHAKRFTIAGAKRVLQLQARRGSGQLKLELAQSPDAPDTVDSIRTIRKDLEEALRLLKGY
jgi:DNA-binding transcriptional MerR regulator